MESHQVCMLSLVQVLEDKVGSSSKSQIALTHCFAAEEQFVQSFTLAAMLC